MVDGQGMVGASVEHHVARCLRCQAELARYLRIRRMLRQLGIERQDRGRENGPGPARGKVVSLDRFRRARAEATDRTAQLPGPTDQLLRPTAWNLRPTDQNLRPSGDSAEDPTAGGALSPKRLALAGGLAAATLAAAATVFGRVVVGRTAKAS